MADIELRSEPATENLTAAAVVSSAQSGDSKKIAPPAHPQKDQIIDLTSKLAADGRLRGTCRRATGRCCDWDTQPTEPRTIPARRWAAVMNATNSAKEPLDKHFAGFLEKLIADVGPLAGKDAGRHAHRQLGSRRAKLDAQISRGIQTRRGYDPLPYLPALAGHVVESPEISERFLWDYRRTIADLIADNHFSHLRELAQKHGMGLSVEAYGTAISTIFNAPRGPIFPWPNSG